MHPALQDGREQDEIMSEAYSALEQLQSRLDQWETRRLLNGAYDDRSDLEGAMLGAAL